MSDRDPILARAHVSSPRRMLGVGVLAVLGVLLIWLAFAAPPELLGLQLMLIALGVVSLWAAGRMWRVTQLALELTDTALRLSDGTVLARRGQIDAIDRGMFAFRPSQGFTLKLTQRAAAGWHPGLWWRFGRRLGVGGVTSGAQTKIMADMISAMIEERDG